MAMGTLCNDLHTPLGHPQTTGNPSSAVLGYIAEETIDNEELYIDDVDVTLALALVGCETYGIKTNLFLKNIPTRRFATFLKDNSKLRTFCMEYDRQIL